jgi:predicted transcriptional regulator
VTRALLPAPDMLLQLRTAVHDTLTDRFLSQADLARATGLSTKHVSRLLTGKVAGTFDVWERILTSLGMKLDVNVIITDAVDGRRLYG